MGLSKHFGENPFLYFFTFGIPMAVMLWVPFLYFGYFLHIKQTFFSQKKQYSDIPIIVLSTILILSLSKHKEVRFLLGIYPIFPIYAALGFVTFLEYNSKILRKFAFIICPLIILSNYALIIDHGIFNYCGSLPVMDYIRNHSNNISNILFLTKCHDTPFYAHIHKSNFTNNFILFTI